MAVDIGETLSGVIPSGSTVGLILMMIVIALLFIIFVGGFMTWIFARKRWNLKVEIKLPRSDGKIVSGEWGKGYFNAKRGVVYIKRPGFGQSKIALKIFDPKRYLQGTDLITVVQLSPVDYRPVLPKSFLEYEVTYEDDETGEQHNVKESVLEIKCDTGHSKAWQVAFDASAKKAYSLQSILQQFQVPIAIAIVVIAVFIGITALWTQLPKG